MEMKPIIKSIPYDEWNDNESLEKIIDELHEGGVNVITGSLDKLINWGRSNSLWSLTFATSCCGIEFMACGCARYDFARFGFEVTRNSPRQADLIMCAGTITHKMAPALKRLYDEMAEPKYVIAVGGCAISGGPFKSSYHVVKGIEEIVPVDVFIPGCPPRPEAIMYGMMQLQRKVKIEKFFGGANHKQTAEEAALGVSNEELTFRSKHGDHRREPIVVTEVPEEFVEELKLFCECFSPVGNTAGKIMLKYFIQPCAEFHQAQGIGPGNPAPGIGRDVQKKHGIAADAGTVDVHQLFHAFDLVIFAAAPEPARPDGDIGLGGNPRCAVLVPFGE